LQPKKLASYHRIDTPLKWDMTRCSF
jgi:hypothetical protein